MKHKLRCFHWFGRQGNSDNTSGSLYAYSRDQLALLAKREKIQIQKIAESSVSSFYKMRFGIKANQVNGFIHQLITLLESSFPITEALSQSLKHREKNELGILIHLVREEVLNGSSLSQSLSRFDCFDPTLLQYIRIGESNGKLADTLRWALEQRTRSMNIKRKLRSALIYPTLVFLVALIVLVIMLIFVLPQFESLFASFGAELPALTQWTLGLSVWTQNYGLYLLMGTTLFTLVITTLLRSGTRLRYRFDALLLGLPIIGKALRSGEWARFSLILASSLGAGLPILNAWHNATRVVENGYLNQHLSKAQHKINQGMRLSDAMAEVPNLPSELGMLISIGESSGRLTSLLEKASLDLEQQLIDTTDNLGKLIEPFVILLLGGMVGTLVLSIYLPIFSLMNSLH